MEDGAQTGTLSRILLAALALAIPIVGFILMISHARAGETRQEQRWRKSHGLIYWVFIPGLAGALLLAGFAGALPGVFSIIGIIMLALSATLSSVIQRRHEGASDRFRI